MSQWFYAQGGQQKGPVTTEELRALLASGALNPASDLVWNASMPDWKAAGLVPELGGEAPAGPPAMHDPAAYTSDASPLAEIVPGSDPIVVTACVKRGFDLAVRHIGVVLAATILYFAITLGASFLLEQLDLAMGWKTPPVEYAPSPGTPPREIIIKSFEAGYSQSLSPVSTVLSQLLSVFFWLGVTRLTLNIVSGKAFGVGQLFGEIRLLPKAIVANILYFLMVAAGMILLIVPGIYLALRYGHFMNALVDRNLGVIEAFKYSSALTTNNRANLFVLFLFAFLIGVAGCLALAIGLLFAYPVILLSWAVAYRWMQYGPRAVLDFHGTQRPILSTVGENR